MRNEIARVARDVLHNAIYSSPSLPMSPWRKREILKSYVQLDSVWDERYITESSCKDWLINHSNKALVLPIYSDDILAYFESYSGDIGLNSTQRDIILDDFIPCLSNAFFQYLEGRV
jgi:hypothetical protein